MFSLEKQLVKITNINPRAEKHGEDTELAIDIQIEARMSNDVLSEFSSQLKHSLYKASDTPDLIDAEFDKDRPSALKFPKMSGFKWNADLDEYEAIIHCGASEKSNISLSDCKVNAFKFAPQEGGTVVVGFRVQAYPHETDVGRLCALIQREIEVTLSPPD